MSSIRHPSNGFLPVTWPFYAGPLLLVFALLLARTALDFNGLFGQDPYAYAEYARSCRQWWAGAEAPGPFFWPPLYPMLGAALSYLTQDVALALQLISIGAVALTSWWTSRMLQSIGLRHAWAWSLLLLGATPFVLRAGLTVGSDALAMALVAGTWRHWQLAHAQHQPRAMALVVLLGGAAVFTRYPAALLVLPAIFALPWRQTVGAWKAAWALLPLAALGLLFHTANGGQWQAGLSQHPLMAQWSPLHIVQREFSTPEGQFHFALPNGLFYLEAFWHPGYGLLSLPLLALAVWRRREWRWQPALKWSLGLSLAYAIFLAGLPFQNARFLLLAMPLVALVFGHFALRLPATWWEDRRLRLGVAAALLILTAGAWLAKGALQVPLGLNREDRAVVQFLKENRPDGTGKVYTFGVSEALRWYLPGTEIRNFFDEDFSVPEPGDWVLFAPEKWQAQWEGTRMWENWEQVAKLLSVEASNYHGIYHLWQLP